MGLGSRRRRFDCLPMVGGLALLDLVVTRLVNYESKLLLINGLRSRETNTTIRAI